MMDLGDLYYFLWISITRSDNGMFLSQWKYVTGILQHVSMLNCKPARTPADLFAKFAKFDGSGPPIVDPMLYRSFVGALQYLTFTRPNITYVIQQVCLYRHNPREPHFTALKCILRYVRGTRHQGLRLFSFISRDLIAYSETDWASCPVTRRSTSVIMSFLDTIFLHGHLKVGVRPPIPMLGPSIEVWPTLLLRHVGFIICFLNFITYLIRSLLSTVTMLVKFTCRLIWFNINVSSILRLTFILLETKWL